MEEGMMVGVGKKIAHPDVEEQRTEADSSHTAWHFLYRHYKLNSFLLHSREPHLPFQVHHQHLPKYVCVFQLQKSFHILQVYAPV